VRHDDEAAALLLGGGDLPIDRTGHVRDLLFHGERTARPVRCPARRVGPPALRDAAPPIHEAAEAQHGDVAARRVGELSRDSGVEPRDAGIAGNEEYARAVTNAGVAQYVEVGARAVGVCDYRQRCQGSECSDPGRHSSALLPCNDKQCAQCSKMCSAASSAKIAFSMLAVAYACSSCSSAAAQ